ncbi:TetR/AcrR family transcriptional regulator [Yinghuangia sp. YIM S09857]|uniref:TetR/AcrR family transcriptional regulator n=1 Tax=Yinghuangia sp. YIM S09857 TaxID=3436929 RepID=UPI003F53711E
MAERRRGRELEEALLDAAWDELVERGYAGFTMDAVAQRAGTSRPVLYRRWPDRHHLVRAAVLHASARIPVETPDTGSLRGDMIGLLQGINATRVHLAVIMSIQLAAYYQETGTSPADLRDFAKRTGRPNLLDPIYERAVARGEIDPVRVTERMKSLPFDLLKQEFFMTFRPVADEVIEEIVDTLFLPLVTTPGRNGTGVEGS